MGINNIFWFYTFQQRALYIFVFLIIYFECEIEFKFQKSKKLLPLILNFDF